MIMSWNQDSMLLQSYNIHHCQPCDLEHKAASKDDFYWDQDDQCSKFQNYHYCDRYHPHRSDARCQIASLSVSSASGSDHPLSISSFLHWMPQIHKNWIAQTQNCHRYINTECNKHRKCSECHNYKNAECKNTKMH